MKNLTLLFLIGISLQSQGLLAQVCDRKKILTLMAQKKIINLKDRSVCLDMNDFPSIRVKMKDQKQGLDINTGESAAKQYDAVKKIISTLNTSKSLEGDQKFAIITKGVADGTYNGEPPAEDKAEEDLFLKQISDEKGALSQDLVKKVIGAYDEAGSKAIVEALDKYYARKGKKIPFALIDEKEAKFVQANTRLKSMVRNSVRAKSRAQFLCTQIAGSPDACQTQGQISPSLDSGEHNFIGCCDGRRGAIIDIVPPDSLLKSKSASGSFQPNFRKTSAGLQGKMNLAASMSIFQLKIPKDAELEKKVLEEEDFSPEVISKDKKRFSEALKGTGCEGNQFAIDAVRRIYWQVKAQEGTASPELLQAITSGDFAKVNKYFDEKAKGKRQDLNLLSTLSTGGNDATAAAGNPTSSDCTAKQLNLYNLGYDKDELKTCKLIASPELQKKLDEINKENPKSKPIENLDQLFSSDWLKPKKSKNQSSFVVSDAKANAKGNYYIYDSVNKQSFQFSFNRECPMSGIPAKNVKIKWNTESVNSLNISCLQQVSNKKFTIPATFHPDATVSSGMPTDAFNCLDSSKAIEQEMTSGQGQEAEQAGEPYCKNQPSVLKLDINSIHKHHCKACQSGSSFDKKGDLKYVARHGNPSQTSNADLKLRQNPMAIATFENSHKTKNNPLSMGSMKHFQSYVIQGCGTSCADACACLKQKGLNERLKTAEVVDFSSLPGVQKKGGLVYNGKDEDKTGSFACIYTPPVPDTCSYNPMGGGTKDATTEVAEVAICPLEASLTAMKAVGGDLVVGAKDLDAYEDSCQKLNFPISEPECEQLIKTQNGGNGCFEAKNKHGLIKDNKPVKSATSAGAVPN